MPNKDYNISFIPERDLQGHCHQIIQINQTAAWLGQLGERRSAEREVMGSNPGRTNTKGL